VEGGSTEEWRGVPTNSGGINNNIINNNTNNNIILSKDNITED